MVLRKSSGRDFFSVIFLAFVALLSFLPVFFHSMKYDIIDQYLPWRYFVSECITNGMLPVWNPYTHLGYPIHADPQSGAWYPFVWILSFLSGYNIYCMHFEYIFHAWLGGCGMYLVARLFTGNRNISVLAATGYMLSGFITGNAQHITWIISAAWIPFVFYFFLRMGLKKEWDSTFLFAISFFMLLTGGYPAFSIVTFYTLIILGLLILFVRWRKKESTKKFILKVFVASASFLLCSAVMLVSIFKSFELAGRSEGLSRTLAMANPFSPQSMLSFLFPIASLKDPGFFNTDISMSNAYFGLVLFAGFIISLYRSKSLTEWLLLAGSIFFLLCSMGSYTPLRGLLYDYLPFMDLFRMPSLFRLFFIMGFILLSAISLHNIYLSGSKQLLNVLKAFACIYIIALLIAFVKGDHIGLIPEKYITWTVKASFSTAFIIQSLAGIIALIIIIGMIRKRSHPYLLLPDLLLAIWLCAPLTIVSDVKLKSVHAIAKHQPAGFPLPDMDPMISHADRTDIISPFWCNLGILKKQPVFDGYNNFQTKQYLEYEASPFIKHTLKNPIIYISNQERTGEFANADTNLLAADSSWIFLDEIRNTSTADTVISAGACRLIKFSPVNIITVANVRAASYLTIQQQFDDCWQATLNGKQVSIAKSNGFNMSVELPAGNNIVEFSYSDNRVLYGLIVTAISLCITVILALINAFIPVRKPGI